MGAEKPLAQVLVTVQMVNEGYDVASIDCLVMARVTESEIVFVQQVGRGLRKNPNDVDHRAPHAPTHAHALHRSAGG